ncbi:hypothetical protein [Jiella avicenniae]|nr:hypothetical protein [Jiella avicenniae]
MILANRKNIGPAADCAECLYEEFFLTSWANGDPALLEQFSDDPSNVHHSYLNDPVSFRNFHAGPKETHVFHLHAHQWFAGNDQGRGTYLDSQTVAPRQGFTYDIYHGGLMAYAPGQQPSGKGWWETMGSGNRNRTIGDSIFHCHLYPHFAQGMWELWRVHDVLEDGTRKLPDGQAEKGLSLAERALDGLKRRPGSVDPWTGAWVAPDAGGKAGDTVGTPIPAIVPLPNQPLPLLPTYEGEETVSAVVDKAKNPPAEIVPAAASPGTTAETKAAAMPGYPFTLAGRPGHRPPQAPMDIARKRNGADEVTGAYADAGLPRHVVQDGATRKLGIGELPPQLSQENAEPAKLPLPTTEDGSTPRNAEERKRERVWSQLVAKMLALGDFSAHLEKAKLELLPYDGTPLERAAMGFHFNGEAWPSRDTDGKHKAGTALELRKADGSPSGRPLVGSYESLRSPSLGSLTQSTDLFAVNGAPPKPGAPFADPCGGTAGSGKRPQADPLVAGAPYRAGLTEFPFDVGLAGFRRFEVSAVQLDLVTNRAGWHDPQARIAVLTEASDRFKDDEEAGFPGASISPLVSAREEPFFFRALSGECVEFRHTNELPKELELDDFQVKTPTDTIGQHIHLVKFDVTSSDGSGNGFNYEDGTFAPDEVASRICAAESVSGGDIVTTRNPGALDLLRPSDLCKSDEGPSEPANKNWWRMKRSTNEDRFQTTVQRWFADPILSDDGEGGVVDRTMRTVFSHDHFGPSSIQQHGYYTALVIEPRGSQWTKPDGTSESPQRVAGDLGLVNGSEIDIGTRKRVVNAADQKVHPDFREFMLAIADFALLYDPRDSETKKDLFPQKRPGYASEWEEFSGAGMATLTCELMFKDQPKLLDDVCGSAMKQSGGEWFADENVPPSWHAGGRIKDTHQGSYRPGLLTAEDQSRLSEHLLAYRRGAAGEKPDSDADEFASPVAPPERPESISVDHHDPYLVNYRGEPIPLRVGTKLANNGGLTDCRLQPLAQPDMALAPVPTDAVPIGDGLYERTLADGTVVRFDPRKASIGAPRLEGNLTVGGADFGNKAGVEDIAAFRDCSVEYQRTDEQGDMANVFSSLQHFDPATPILETYSGERNVIRLIQGAQEVQHTFNLEGVVWRRNIDQAFPSMMRLWDSIWRGDWPQGVKAYATMHQTCQEFGAAREGRPREYAQWSSRGWQSFPDNSPEQNFWRAYTHRIAECDNQEGVVTAQEVGISEHFEFGGSSRGGVNSGLQPDLSNPSRDGDGMSEGQATSPGGRLASGDYLYDFGSQDALWNGAWGLLRVYGAPERDEYDPNGNSRFPDPDTTACLLAKDNLSSVDPVGYAKACDRGMGNRRKISDRLAALPKKPDDTLENGVFGLQPSANSANSVSCPADARHVYALAVAQNDADRAYSRDLRDPDGLQFTLIKPADVFRNYDDPNKKPIDQAKLGDFMMKFGEGGRRQLGAPIRISARKPAHTPFVLRVRAGDCVHLAVVNALEDARQEGAPLAEEQQNTSSTHSQSPDYGFPVLADEMGDARMPPIVPLNVDPRWNEDDRQSCPVGDASCQNRSVTWIADLTNAEIDEHKRLLSPSASLALRLPILTLTPIDRLAAPHGSNRMPPLRPQSETALTGEGGPEAEFITFYAGRGAVPELSEREKREIAEQYLAGIGGGSGGRQLRKTLAPQPIVVVAGTGFEELPPALSDPQEAIAFVEEEVRSLPVTGEPVPVGRNRALAIEGALNTLADASRATDSQLPEPLRQPDKKFIADMFAEGVISREKLLMATRAADRVTAFVLENREQPQVARSMPPSIRDFTGGTGFGAPGAAPPSAPESRGAPGDADSPPTIVINLARRGCALSDPRDSDGSTDNVDSVATCVPYAFGALPIKSFGDVIGHGSHGLLGALVIEPANWHPQSGDHAFSAIGTNAIRGAVRARMLELGAALDSEPTAGAEADTWAQAKARAEAEIGAAPVLLGPGDPPAGDPPTGIYSGASFSAVFEGGTHRVREHVVFWRDGMNLWDRASKDQWRTKGSESETNGLPAQGGPVADCPVCDDSYDFGEQGVNYQSAPFHIRLRGDTTGKRDDDGAPARNPETIESHYDLNALEFDPEFYRTKQGTREEGSGGASAMPILRAEVGEEVVIRVLHPSGRARQRAFVTTALDYDDLFPGFGFPHAALLAPGKGITASIARPVREGCYLWQDGPAPLRAGGTWGLLDVVEKGRIDDPDATKCRRSDAASLTTGTEPAAE